MDGIKICEWTNEIPFEAIHDVLVAAHANSNVEFDTTNLTCDELNDRLTNGGTVFIAMDGERVVGTMTVCTEHKKMWYANGVVARLRFLAVHPEYAGRHIASKLVDACAQRAKEQGITTLLWTTAANNSAAIATSKKNSFILVDYHHFARLNHDSVSLVRWKNLSWLSAFRAKVYYTLRREKILLKRSFRP